MNLESIAGKLQTDGVGLIGKSIFIANMPVDVKTGVILRSAYLGTPIDYELPNYRKTHFHAATRGKDYAEGNALMKKVMTSLTFDYLILPGMDFRFCRPVIEPVTFPESDGKVYEFLVIFDATYVIVA